ncbi:MAG: LysM peptidoglycan-binding domain-containing protein [Saprospiraceae bacterium]|nr:LysM peptidoglycan-binding domain-containing protein [Saprospiraceae bacterium]
MQYHFILLVYFLNLSFKIYAQDQPLYQLPEKALVQFDEHFKPFIVHQVTKKQTLYSIARLYSQKEIHLLKLNELSNLQSIKEGDYLKVPVNMSFKQTAHSIPLYYKVLPKETLYHILKHKTSFSRKEFETINPPVLKGMQANMLVQIGWMPGQEPSKLNESLISTREDSMKNAKIDSNAISLVPEIKTTPTFTYNFEKRGVAARSKIELGRGRFYALHRDVPKNKFIQILNPITGRSVLAKVVGRIPKTFAEDIEVVVSSEAAKELWAIDKKFFVEVKYSK